VGVEDLTNVRFTTNAVWETAASLHALANPRHHLLHQRLRRLVPKGPDFDLGLLLTLAGHPSWLPDVWAPAPALRPGPPLDQLDAVRRTDPAVAEADLERLQLGIGPRDYLDRTADALQGWWTAVLEPLWDRVDAIARADIAHHQTTLAAQGLAATMPELNRGLSVAGDRLRVDLDEELSLRSCGQGIWFVPSVFRWPWVAVDVRESVPPVVSYGARGAGRVWQRAGRSASPPGLPDLLGRSRALILESLDVPTSTTALAQSLGLSLSTVSEHLSVLASAGLLESRRAGQRVLYWRTMVGDLLVDGESSAARLG